MFLIANKFSNKFLVNIFFSLVFINYLTFFLIKEKTFFVFFGFFIIINFVLILLKNYNKNKLLILILLALCLISLSSPVSDWDGRSIWLFNAKIIFFEDSLNNFFSYSPYYSHPDYPIFLPVLSATMAKLIGTWNEVLPKFSHLILTIPPIILLTQNLNKKSSLFIFIVLILFVYEKRIINGEVDVLLSLYSISLIKLLSEITSKNPKYKNFYTDLILILFHFCFLTLFKMEGLALIFCIFFSFLIIYFKENKILSKKLLLIFIFSYMPILIWLLYAKNTGAAGGGIEISSAQKMMSGGQRFFENIINFKFILYLIGKIMINKQMIISLIIFVFIFSKYIKYNDGSKLIIENALLEKNMLLCYMSIISYTLIMITIMIMSEGSPFNIQIQYWQAMTASDRYFLPIHSMLLLCAMNLIESKKS